MPQKRTASLLALVCAVAATLVAVALRDGASSSSTEIAPGAPALAAADADSAVSPSASPATASRPALAALPFGDFDDALVVAVRWDDGAPCPGAVVTASDEESPMDVDVPLEVADDEGLATLSPKPPPGTRLIARLPDGAVGSAVVSAGDATTILLSAHAVVALRIVDAWGAPLVGGVARLRDLERAGAEVVVREIDREGRVLLRRLPSDREFELSVLDSDLADREAVDAVGAGLRLVGAGVRIRPPAEGEVRLGAVVAARVRCVDSAGVPVAGVGASFALAAEGETTPRAARWEPGELERRAVTGKDGRAEMRISGFASDPGSAASVGNERGPQRGVLTATLTPFDCLRSAAAVVTRSWAIAPALDFGDVVLDVPAAVPVHVVDGEGEPVGIAEVSWIGAPDGCGARTDSDGDCVVRPAGSTMLTVEHPRFCPKSVDLLSVPFRSGPVRVVLEQGASLLVAVTPAARRDVVALRAYVGGVETGVRWEGVGPDGVAAFPRLIPGVSYEASLTAEDDDDPPAAPRIKVAPLRSGERRTVALTAPTPTSVRLALVDERGAAVADGDAIARDGPHLTPLPSGELASDALRWSKPHECRWIVRAPGRRSSEVVLTVFGTVAERVVLTPAKTLTVRLRDAAGGVPPVAVVDVYDAEGAGLQRLRSGDGVFHFADLARDPATLVARVGGRSVARPLRSDDREVEVVVPSCGIIRAELSKPRHAAGRYAIYAASADGAATVLVDSWSCDASAMLGDYEEVLAEGRWRIELRHVADPENDDAETLIEERVIDVRPGETTTVAF